MKYKEMELIEMEKVKKCIILLLIILFVKDFILRMTFSIIIIIK